MMFSSNRITKLLNIKYPIIQGAMAWVADADLAAAVSDGGGLGIIAAGNMPPEALDRELIKIRTLTDKPFGLNIMLMSSTALDVLELAASHKVPVVTTGAGLPGKVIERLLPLGAIVNVKNLRLYGGVSRHVVNISALVRIRRPLRSD
jgi:enoyl-[acyl-carrier protein] reductase II